MHGLAARQSILMQSHVQSHDVYVHQANYNILILTLLVKANPHFNIVSCGLWQCGAEPRRVVEFTAGAGGTTPLTIP